MRDQVAQLMSENVITVRMNDDLAVLHDLMEEQNLYHIPVVDDEGELCGIVSHRDLLRRALIEQPRVPEVLAREELERTPVWEIVVGSVHTVTPDTRLSIAAQMLVENKIGCLPVVEAGRLVGIVSATDFVRLHAERPELYEPVFDA